MPLYTVIAEHDGGLYITQHHARSAASALIKWVQDDSSSRPVHGGRRATREQLEMDLLEPDNGLVPLDGCTHVWCTSEIVNGKLLLLNVVETKV